MQIHTDYDFMEAASCTQYSMYAERVTHDCPLYF